MIYTDGTHLVADTLEQLHDFGERVGLMSSSFQDGQHPHYDLNGFQYRRALELGAERINAPELLVKSQRMTTCSGQFDEVENH
jgi:hypothetical protein